MIMLNATTTDRPAQDSPCEFIRDTLLTPHQVDEVCRKLTKFVDVGAIGDVIEPFFYHPDPQPSEEDRRGWNIRERMNNSCRGLRHFPLSETQWEQVCQNLGDYSRPARTRELHLLPNEGFRKLSLRHADEVERSGVATTLLELMWSRSLWEGTLSELMNELIETATVYRLTTGWPRTAEVFEQTLRAHEAALASFDLEFRWNDTQLSIINSRPRLVDSTAEKGREQDAVVLTHTASGRRWSITSGPLAAPETAATLSHREMRALHDALSEHYDTRTTYSDTLFLFRRKGLKCETWVGDRSEFPRALSDKMADLGIRRLNDLEAEQFVRYLRLNSRRCRTYDWFPVGLRSKRPIVTVIEGFPTSSILLDFMADRESWSGGLETLLLELTALATPHCLNSGWPKDAKALGRQLRKHREALATFGVEFEGNARKLTLHNTWHNLPREF